MRLTTGKQENLNLSDTKLKDLSDYSYGNNYKTTFTFPRENLMVLSKTEKEQHEKFIGEMTDSLWKKIK